ncbi:unnamed protein product, partial [Prorocentrum cordatum]
MADLLDAVSECPEFVADLAVDLGHDAGPATQVPRGSFEGCGFRSLAADQVGGSAARQGPAKRQRMVEGVHAGAMLGMAAVVTAATATASWTGKSEGVKACGIGVVGVPLAQAKDVMGPLCAKLMSKECDLCRVTQG